MQVRILTPSAETVKEVETVSAVDGSGSFGIMARHTEFLSVLRPCILAFGRGGESGYAVVDGGVIRVDKDGVVVATRRAVEGGDLEELKGLMLSEFREKEEKEATFMDLLANMEKLLVDRMVKFERGTAGL